MICLHKSTAFEEDKFLVYEIAMLAQRGVAVLFVDGAMTALSKSDRIETIVASRLRAKQFFWGPSVKPAANLIALAASEMRVAVERHLRLAPFQLQIQISMAVSALTVFNARDCGSDRGENHCKRF
jgi:hypothetical protein